MRVLAGVSLLVAITLGMFMWVDSRRADAAGLLSGSLTPRIPEHRPPPAIAKSSRLVLGGRVRCTATVGSRVQAGHVLSVRFAFHNVSKHPVKAVLGTGLVLRAADGMTYDSSVPPLTALPRPPPVPKKLRPGATVTLRDDIPIRWRGPLRLMPGCEQKRLSVLRVAVTAPWPPPGANTAVADVVAATGHLLDECRPQTPGVAVSGQIDAPNGSAPPMSAECSVSLESEGAFWVAQALVLTPPGLPDVTVLQPYEVFAPPYSVFGPPTVPRPYEAVAWQFVVTRDGARPVAATMADATNPSDQTYPSWDLNGTTWQLEGTISCGAQGFAWGMLPMIEFISACPS